MCEFSSNEMGMKLHTQKVHQYLLRYECTECEYRTFYRNTMNVHIKSEHKQENQNVNFLYLKCTLCIGDVDHENHQYTKRKRKGLLRTKGKHRCTEKNCDFASDYRAKVQNHIENEHSGILKFKCYICDCKSYYKHHVIRKQPHTKIKF